MLKETIETTYLHFNRAKDNYEEILNYQLDIEIYENKETIKTIDAFIFRFIKLQDFMGDKLFKELLKKIGEYKDNMALIDILDKLEKLAVVKNNKPEAVVISIVEYERIKMLANLAEDLSIQQMVHERIGDDKGALLDYDDYAKQRKAKIKHAV